MYTLGHFQRKTARVCLRLPLYTPFGHAKLPGNVFAYRSEPPLATQNCQGMSSPPALHPRWPRKTASVCLRLPLCTPVGDAKLPGYVFACRSTPPLATQNCQGMSSPAALHPRWPRKTARVCLRLPLYTPVGHSHLLRRLSLSSLHCGRNLKHIILAHYIHHRYAHSRVLHLNIRPPTTPNYSLLIIDDLNHIPSSVPVLIVTNPCIKIISPP